MPKSKVRINIALDRKLWEDFTIKATKEYRSKQEIIYDMIAAYVDEK
jgi:metal-responsive CopG/Arc/MetJ family transcriptional regulator